MGTVWKYKSEIYNKLSGDVRCDVVVVGGGLAGILTAYSLSRAGLKTVLLEAECIGNGQSRGTTAKITLCHGGNLAHIENTFGHDAAELFVKKHFGAIETFEKMIREENIECGFERLPTYLYALYGERHVRREWETTEKFGIPCELTKKTELPFEIALALKYENQAQFDPLRFMIGLIHGFDVYEYTRAVGIKTDGVVCENGTVTAKHVIIATNYPILCHMKGMFPLKLHRKTAHVCLFDNCRKLNGMYIGVDGGYNYRSCEEGLIVSGETHVSGLGSGGSYERIKKNTLSHFRTARPLMEWSAEDAESVDGLPYIGRLDMYEGNVYVIAGFGTWGMTNSMVASELICDLVCGRSNEAEKLYSPSRLKMNSASDELTQGVSRAINGVVLSRFKASAELSDVPLDFGMIVRHKGKKTAVYKDKNGGIHTSSPYCPHLQCELSWNDDDKTWDCPCHGSRFDIDGNLIAGPADKGI